MIIYKTQLGDKDLNIKAIDSRELYKPLLKGCVCHICSKDTIISWNIEDNFSPIITPCCEEFGKKLSAKLKLKK